MLSSPLRDRFGTLFRLDFYTAEDIEKILERSAKILNVSIDADACKRLANSTRHTPRIANRLLRRVRDFAEVHGKNQHIDFAVVEATLASLKIDHLGLDKVDREILTTIIEKFGGGPVGLNTIAAATSEEEETVESVYEPFLLKLGFLERTQRGRVVTKRAYEHMGISL